MHSRTWHKHGSPDPACVRRREKRLGFWIPRWSARVHMAILLARSAILDTALVSKRTRHARARFALCKAAGLAIPPIELVTTYAGRGRSESRVPPTGMDEGDPG